jgi:hypothetical protein
LSHFLCISCEILARPLYLCVAKSPHVIDIHLKKRGLHDEPGKLRSSLQESIDSFDGSNYEAILLGYGLCGNSAIGLQARSFPLVIPRVHDCISLLLGSSEKYLDQFNQFPGTYWYSQDLLQKSATSGKYSSLGAASNNDLADQFKTLTLILTTGYSQTRLYPTLLAHRVGIATATLRIIQFDIVIQVGIEPLIAVQEMRVADNIKPDQVD